MVRKWSLRKKNNSTGFKKAALGFFLCIGLTVGVQAQQRTLDLDSAVAIAIDNHPNMKAADLTIQKEQSLQELKYNLGTTEISYQGDGLFDRDFGQQVNQIGVVQNIPNPGIVKAQNQLQNELSIRSTYAKQITENELKWQVRQLYADIQFQKELNKLYTNLTNTYAEYQRKAEVRVNAGAANPIESLTLKSKRQEYNLLQRQSSMVITNLEKQFQILLNADEPVTTIDSILR